MEYNVIVGISCFLGMMVLILIGTPIFLSLLGASLVGLWLIGGPGFALTQFTGGPYRITASYTFAVVPMFLLMGVLAGASGAAEGAYNSVSKWLGGIRGGLMIATVGAAALFGACSGSPTASSAVFCKISLPELERFHYNKRLSMGCIAIAGTLAALIPPSIAIIIICILVDLSIGKVLIAGIIPGILMAVALSLCIMLVGIINPSALPKIDTRPTLKEKFISLGGVWPIVLLFLLVVGGLYMGIFSPTAAGAVGAFGALVYAIFNRMKAREIFKCFYETVVMNAQFFPVIIGGFIFSRFIALTGLVDAFMNAVSTAQIPALATMCIFILVLLFLGCILDPISMLVISLPIFFPILTGLGYDPIALAIIIVILINIAGITPPIGLGCFVVASVARVDPAEVFGGVLPFFITSLIVMFLIIFFPIIATWLPGLMY